MLDNYFFAVFNHYKPKLKAKANTIALLYILFLQTSLVLALGSFLMLFLKQLHVELLTGSKAWTLFVITLIILIFRNWIYYTGKKRKVLNSKIKKTATKNIWLLWTFPFICLIIAILLMQKL